jgi:hypothetical protein
MRFRQSLVFHKHEAFATKSVNKNSSGEKPHRMSVFDDESKTRDTCRQHDEAQSKKHSTKMRDWPSQPSNTDP